MTVIGKFWRLGVSSLRHGKDGGYSIRIILDNLSFVFEKRLESFYSFLWCVAITYPVKYCLDFLLSNFLA